MSIYATLWQIRLPTPEWTVLVSTEHGDFRLEDGGLVPHEEEWIEITFQGVPGHIGHPSYYPDGDPYASFLPPVVDDPEKLRAVVIVQEGRNDKDIQRYVDPLLTLSGDEYHALSFEALMRKNYEAMRSQPRFQPARASRRHILEADQFKIGRPQDFPIFGSGANLRKFVG